MSKKDYELIAGAVKRTYQVTSWLERNTVKKQAKYQVLQLVANDLAGSLGGDNPKFDQDKFLAACGF